MIYLYVEKRKRERIAASQKIKISNIGKGISIGVGSEAIGSLAKGVMNEFAYRLLVMCGRR